MKSKARIVKRTYRNGYVDYVIQKKHFLFRWWWVDARVDCGLFSLSFSTLELAQKKIYLFDGTPKQKDEVVYP